MRAHRMFASSAALLALLALIGLAPVAIAAWNPWGTPLDVGGHAYPDVVLDAQPDGSIGVRAVGLYGTARERALRISVVTGDGTIAWGGITGYQGGPAVRDGAGGYFLVQAWAQTGPQSVEYRVFHHFANGTVDPSWPATGALVSNSVRLGSVPRAVADGAGGLYVLYHMRRGTVPAITMGTHLARIDAGGTPHAGWPADGRRLWAVETFLPDDVSLDESGGAFVLLPPGDGSIVLHRVRPDGTIDPAYTGSGVYLGPHGTAGPDGGIARLVRSGNSTFALWQTGVSGAEEVTVLEFDVASGSGGGAWSQVALACASGGTLMAFPDGSDGLFVFQKQIAPSSDLLAVHYLADGSFADPVRLRGGSVLPAGATAATGGSFAAGPDEAGGALLAWDDGRSNQDSIYVWGVQGDGSPSPAWPVGGVVLPVGPVLHETSSSRGHACAVLTDAPGRAYVAWNVGDINYDELFLARVVSPLVVDAPPVVTRPGLRLAHASANPARGRCVLLASFDSAEPARLELFDVTGRRVTVRDLRGAGEHREAFDAAALGGAGVYFARLAQGREVRTLRVAVTR